MDWRRKNIGLIVVLCFTIFLKQTKISGFDFQNFTGHQWRLEEIISILTFKIEVSDWGKRVSVLIVGFLILES